MKYFIQYPIFIDCNISCNYCFHKDSRKILPTDSEEDAKAKLHGGAYGFGVDDYIKWRETHLYDAEEIVVNFAGGEPSIPKNMKPIVEFVDKSKIERLDFLSNGVGPIESYQKLMEYKNRIYRFGLTFHRDTIGDNKELKKRFFKTAMYLKDQGVNLYIKELLILKYKPQILANRSFWTSLGVEFKIQDFKGYARGQDFEELKRYKLEDVELLSKEYWKTEEYCSCLPGYKQIMIRGGWMAGDILGCWIDPAVVGNIKDNTFNPNYRVHLDFKNEKTEIIGVPKIYKGTYSTDRWDPNEAKSMLKEPIC